MHMHVYLCECVSVSTHMSCKCVWMSEDNLQFGLSSSTLIQCVFCLLLCRFVYMEHKLLLSSTLSLQKHWPYSQLRHLAFFEFWLSNSGPQTCAVSAYSANNLFRIKLTLHKKEKHRCIYRRVSHKKSKQGRMI